MVQYRKIERLSVLADSFDLFLIDQFGVLHDGVKPYRGTIECLASLKSRGKSVVLLSNSGKRAAANIARLADLGFSRELFDHVVTSGEVAWQGIVHYSFGMPYVPGKSMFVVGHDDHDYGFEKLGVRLVDDPAAADFVMIAASRAPKIARTIWRDPGYGSGLRYPGAMLQSGSSDAHRRRHSAERRGNCFAVL